MEIRRRRADSFVSRVSRALLASVAADFVGDVAGGRGRSLVGDVVFVFWGDGLEADAGGRVDMRVGFLGV